MTFFMLFELLILLLIYLCQHTETRRYKCDYAMFPTVQSPSYSMFSSLYFFTCSTINVMLIVEHVMFSKQS